MSTLATMKLMKEVEDKGNKKKYDELREWKNLWH